ncbi:hypothetical protein FGADI_7322 [Fusarium gaditjirri]|uniref:Thioester reductase (TE) domain-containing protein n=1 Tax=Fusarium gaditjirri TaxID=282569 RepID=A0A8H4T5E2_9HYPO|nr:hypothetical protein FGADI_7322 [Fusarium gaditjirri]
MGTLAAGAIVTVLDPQYPYKDMEVFYLQFSKPKTLISIRKAKEESGPLALLVQKFIDGELAIKIKIPDLHFTDDGELTVGEGSADFFANVKERASAPSDVLIGPDSILGPACTIINKYGTTETSRPVSYFEAPSTQEDPMALDSIPAGWGMKGVQVLVVDREEHTKLCSIGMVGEIYIRAAGLTEAGLTEARRSSSITGDLGEYRPDGALSLTHNLPFPDASEEDLKSWESISRTKKTIATQWPTLIPCLNAKTARPDASFFDCGYHSLLIQQLLLNIRRELRVDSYSLDELTNALDAKYQGADPEALSPSNGATFVLTGATGFLSAYLAKDTLDRKNTELIACIRGAKDLKFAKEPFVRPLKGYGLLQDSWTERVSCVIGDLSKPRLGLDDASWKHVADTADTFIHKAEYVH